MSSTPGQGVYMDSQLHLVYPKGATHLDGIPKETLDIIHEHWGTYPPQHPLILHVVGICFFFLWVVNFFGNGCVIYIFMKVKSLRTPTNMFVVNLAVSDLIMMTTQGLPVVINAFTLRYWMWGVLGCSVYGAVGAVCGTCSIMTMVVIGYDRYNVIVKGFSGTKITRGIALVVLLVCWGYSVGCCIPPFFGWGSYSPEGLLVTCSYDYLTQDWNRKSFMVYAFVFNFTCPVIMILLFYYKIVKAVVAHESALRAQAKKMNVDSLRSNVKDEEETVEVRIAKVAITNVLLWLCTWTPYAIVCFIGCFVDMTLVTPLVSQLPSFLAKTGSCINPVVYAVSHPKFREAIAQEIPWLGIGDPPKQAEPQKGIPRQDTVLSTC